MPFPHNKRTTAESDGATVNIVGRVARVRTAIPGGVRRGEVTVTVRGGTETYMAVADQPLDIGSEVLVVEDRGERTVFVVPL